MPTLTFIGAGNVAWHLTQALEDAGHRIAEVYSRELSHAQQLCRQLYDTQPTTSLDFSKSPSEIFIISVKDDAVAAVADQLIVPQGVTIYHTSGTLPLAVLKRFPNRGVFYPLQTFSKSRPLDIERVPFCLEASHPATEQQLVTLAQSISKTVYLVSSEERKILHIGAVFACNFTNHLFSIARQLVEKENLEFELLKPLIEETVAKALATDDPAKVQTGPAIRHDVQTIQHHLRYLKEQPFNQKIYKLLTESIQSGSE